MYVVVALPWCDDTHTTIATRTTLPYVIIASKETRTVFAFQAPYVHNEGMGICVYLVDDDII